MPRPFFNRSNQTDTNWKEKKSDVNLQHISFHPQARLRQNRSSAYVELCTGLDTGEKVLSEAKMSEILAGVDQEFADVEKQSLPIGIVSACYLGHPFEVHTLDLREEIIMHYKVSEPLPGGLERARTLALHPSYAFVEVYPDCLRVVDKEGEVSVIQDQS
ncbi:hypothetical protein SAMN05444392_1215 [Seinonella peptonophila]|uniref:Uncharacterized protein n=1 Tax=Seinonella peptonophila TaxID=112248 RepID=A0A1M5BC99_9BACL|nr:hypothetical protein [Seinonella peptonophila]SHF40048.1 hypothetical protein SAMN05444392_1215 [Seinonella peptonophila]